MVMTMKVVADRIPALAWLSQLLHHQPLPHTARSIPTGP
jgi:hypothetical protein